MAAITIEKKAYYVGTWKDDVVTDNIIKQITARTQADKGRKVKLRLSGEGLKISKSTLFQGSILFDSIPLRNIYFMTVNQSHPTCLLGIVSDLTRKYNIQAFRCMSELDAGHFVQSFKELKRNISGNGDNLELTRSDDGNWTLRGRNTLHSHRQALQIQNGKPNGDVRHIHTAHAFRSPLPSDGDSVTKEDMYMSGKTLHNIGVQTKHHDIDIDNMSEVSDVSSFRDELESLSQELREIKFLLEKSTGISAEEHYRRAREGKSNGNNNYLLREVPPAATATVFTKNESNAYTDEAGEAHAVVSDYRSFGVQTAPKSHASQHYTSVKSSTVAAKLGNGYSGTDQQRNAKVVTVPVSHTMGNSHLVEQNGKPIERNGRIVTVPVPKTNVDDVRKPEPEVRMSHAPSEPNHDGEISGRNSLKVKFDPKAVMFSQDKKSRSLRLKSNFMAPTTVVRPIEYTYPRPTVIRQPLVNQPITSRRYRPKSMYIISGSQPLRVHNPGHRPTWTSTHFEAPI